MTRVAIIAALPGELGPLVRGWKRESRAGVDVWRRAGGEWIAACAGIGAGAAARAFAEVEREGAVDVAVSVGWAGALREGFEAGRAYIVSGVVDARTGERFPTSAPSADCWLVTHDRVADREEKLRLAGAHGAALVDMEAAAIARMAAARGVPFCCIKGVSDGPSDRMPDFNTFISSDGSFLAVRFILFAVLRPWLWPALARMGGNGRRSAEGISGALAEALGKRGAGAAPRGRADFKPGRGES
jgi:adenosylhomocysteine nucleosidase